jgi:hypothetical protein
MTTLAAVFIGALGSLVAAFLFPAIYTTISSALVRLLGWLPIVQSASFSGRWRVLWTVESTSFPSEVVDNNVVVKQLGRRMYARFQAANVECHIAGTIDNGRYITGTWRDRTEGGYHGAFQFIVDPATKDFSGRWVGFSKTGVIKQGLWKWERITG